MILTLLCQILLMDTRTLAFPQDSGRPTTPSPPLHLPLLSSLSHPPPPHLTTPMAGRSASDLPFRPSSSSSSSKSVRNNITTPIIYNNGKTRPFTASSKSQNSRSTSSSRSSQYIRTRRDPIASPQYQKSSSDWLVPPFNPTQRPRGGSLATASNFNSYGLAYRSILPIRSSPNSHNVNRYTGLYRNRNIFSNGENNDNNNDDYNYNGNIQQYEKISPQEKNDISVNLPSLLGDDNDHFNLPVEKHHLTTTTTAESKTNSAPATEVGSISSTLEMKDVYGGGDLMSRDGISNQAISPNTPKSVAIRQPKLHKPMANEEQDTAIVFPGSVYRSPNKRAGGGGGGSVRPGKATSSTPQFSTTDDEYVPPPLKSLDKAAFESLKLLLETKRISQLLNARTASPKIGSGYASGRPTSTTQPTLDIRGRPKCATQNSGYCDEIDTYPKDFFDSILKNSLTLTPDVFQEVFGDSVDNKTVASDLAGRDGLNLMLDSPLCSSIEHTIYPKVAENKDGKFMYIVNHDEYIQGVRVEKCVKEGSPCLYLEGSLTGYQSTCRQKYIYRKLLAFTRDGKATTDTFRLPACCVCHVRSVFVDDRINTAGFGSDNTDYAPSSVIIPKKSGENSTISDPTNGTVVEHEDGDDKLSDNTSSSFTATEISHDDVMDFPTVLPDTVAAFKNGSGAPEEFAITEDEGVTGDPLISFRAFK